MAGLLSLLPILALAIFCLSALIVIYIYAGFPVCLLLAARGGGTSAAAGPEDEQLPRV